MSLLVSDSLLWSPQNHCCRSQSLQGSCKWPIGEWLWGVVLASQNLKGSGRVGAYGKCFSSLWQETLRGALEVVVWGCGVWSGGSHLLTMRERPGCRFLYTQLFFMILFSAQDDFLNGKGSSSPLPHSQVNCSLLPSAFDKLLTAITLFNLLVNFFFLPGKWASWA